jgi:NADH:ubiquinone oxidoreductase subunit 3 (subunit A)
MDASTIHEYRFVLAFLGLGLVFGMISVAVPHFIAPRSRGEADTFKTYESGIVPERGAWRQFSLAYYLYALLYLAVAVDVIYLLPVAVVFRTLHTWQALVEIVAFVAILAVAVVYSWRTGVFRWD